jgi:hypothetical protein
MAMPDFLMSQKNSTLFLQSFPTNGCQFIIYNALIIQKSISYRTRPARDRAVDFILLAGDTFEDNAVERVLIQQTAYLLGCAGLPGFI